MTREERHALLGADTVAHINTLVDAAPDPTPEVVERLRRIFTHPAGPVLPPAMADAPAADAA